MIEGNFRDVSLPGLLQFLASEVTKSYRVKVSAGTQSGEIFVCRGAVISASYGLLEGEDAVCEFLAWSDGLFGVELLNPQFDIRKNLQLPIKPTTTFVDQSAYLVEQAIGLNALLVPAKAVGTGVWQESLKLQPLEREDFVVLAWIGDGRTMRQAMREFNLDIVRATGILFRLLTTRSIAVVRTGADGQNAPSPADAAVYNPAAIQRFVTTGGQEAAAANVAQQAARAFATDEIAASLGNDAFVSTSFRVVNPGENMATPRPSAPLEPPQKVDIALIRASMEARMRARAKGATSITRLPQLESAAESAQISTTTEPEAGANSVAEAAQSLPPHPVPFGALKAPPFPNQAVFETTGPLPAWKDLPDPPGDAAPQPAATVDVAPEPAGTVDEPYCVEGTTPDLGPMPQVGEPSTAELSPAPLSEPAPPEGEQMPSESELFPDLQSFEPNDAAPEPAFAGEEPEPFMTAEQEAEPAESNLPVPEGVPLHQLQPAQSEPQPEQILSLESQVAQPQVGPAPPADSPQGAPEAEQAPPIPPKEEGPPPTAPKPSAWTRPSNQLRSGSPSSPLPVVRDQPLKVRTGALPLVTLDIERLLQATFTLSQFGRLALTNPSLDQLRRQTLLDVEAGKSLVLVISEGSRQPPAILSSYRYCLDRGYIESVDSVIPLTADLLLGRIELDQYLLQRRRITGDELRDLIAVSRSEGINLPQLLVRSGYLTAGDLDTLARERKRFAFK